MRSLLGLVGAQLLLDMHSIAYYVQMVFSIAVQG
jgi:hypothetical protein